MKQLLLSLVALATVCLPAGAQNRVKNVYTSMNTLDMELLQNTDQTAQLNRYLFAGYNTLCVPMTVEAGQLQAAAPGITLERLAAMGQEGHTLCLYFLDCTQDGLEAGVPYLVRVPQTLNLRLKNTEATAISDNLATVRLSDGMGNTVAFSSTWETLRQEGRYGIPAKQETDELESILIRTDAQKAFLPTRCGFDWEQQGNGATDIVIRHIQSLDQATGINAIAKGTWSAENAIYDLNGRRISTTQKGINIVNGKKVVK